MNIISQTPHVLYTMFCVTYMVPLQCPAVRKDVPKSIGFRAKSPGESVSARCHLQVRWGSVGASSIWVRRLTRTPTLGAATMRVDDGLFTLNHRVITDTFLLR